MFYTYMGYTLKCKCKLFTFTWDLHVMYKKGYIKVGVKNGKNWKLKHINLNFYHMKGSTKHHKCNYSFKSNHWIDVAYQR
jgi:hypothetical protein